MENIYTAHFFSHAMRRLLIAALILLPALSAMGQSYIDYSTILGGDSDDGPAQIIVRNGKVHLFGRTASNDFPVTNGTTNPTGQHIGYLQLDEATGNVLFGTYLGGASSASIFEVAMQIVDGKVHILGRTNAADYPVTNGSSFSGGTNDLVYTQLDEATGAVLFSTYLGGSGNDLPVKMVVEGGNVHITGTTASSDFSTTDGTTYPGSGTTMFYLRLDAATGATVVATLPGPATGIIDLAVNGVGVHIAAILNGTAGTSPFPVTNGSILSGGNDILYVLLNPVDGGIASATYYGGSGTDFALDMDVDGSDVYILSRVTAGYPTTDGTALAGGFFDYGLLKLDATTGLALFSTLVGGAGQESPGTARSFLMVSGGAVYMLGSTQSLNYPITTGPIPAAGTGPNRIAFTKFDAATGAILISTTTTGSAATDPSSFSLNGGIVHIVGSTSASNFPLSSHSMPYQASSDIIYIKLDASNADLLESVLVGSTLALFEGAVQGYYENGTMHIFGATHANPPTTANDFPTTDGRLLTYSNDWAYVQFKNCNPNFDIPSPDAITPALQMVCQNGVVGQLQGGKIAVPSSELPLLYRNGAVESQKELPAQYQWQEATAAAGPWVDIPGAIQKNFTPQPVVATRFYRRLARTNECCGNTLISTSEVAEVRVNADMAPMVDVGGTYNTCPGTNVTLTANVTGGAIPYMYQWDNGAGAMSTATVSPTQSTIYTLTVTDGLGCQQIDQAIVNVRTADAGPATASVCAGQAVQIGTPAIAGLSGVVYNWTPSTGLSCTDCAQPMATVAASTVYTLQLTIPVTGGGTCMTSDMITVNPIAGPTAGGGMFAGPDVAICRGSTAMLGFTGEAGFTYTWAPGNYLSNNATALPTFSPGSLDMPTPNPILYYVTALKDGCIFVDSTYASVIEARAWIDGCGPRGIGMEDRTPDINETYLWVNLGGGTSTFTGPTNTPQTTVSATTTANTVYELQVTHLGTTCTDQVIVTPPCVCNVEIFVDAPFICPSFDLNGGVVTLTAVGVQTTAVPTSSFVYTWSVVGGPNAGLNTYTGPMVQLTDNVNRTYRVTLTSTDNPNFSCTQDIEVNNPAWALPVFAAGDVDACYNSPIAIGQPTVADYTYIWTPDAGLSNANISMPTATVTSTTVYSAMVTDTRSGCVVTDNVTVTMAGVPAVAGPDLLVCDNGTVTLGAPAVLGATYSWNPAGANWQNGTNQNTAQPDVLVATNTTFTLTVTSNGGACVSTDMVDVTVGTPVTPFTLPDINFCPSTPPVTLGTTAPAGLASYSWSPAGPLVTPTMRTTDVKTPLPTSPSTYTLTVRNVNGCEFLTTQTINPTITPPNAGSSQAICLGETADLGSATNPVGPGISYLWTGAAAAQLSSTSSPTTVFTPAAAGTYTFMLSKTEGGCTSTATVVVSVNQFILPALASPTICEGASVQIGATPQAGVSYQWSPATGLSNASISNPTVSGLTQTTTYTLTAIGINGCPATTNIVVAVSPVPAPMVNVPSVTACLGDNGVTLNPVVSPAGTYTYQWSPNNGSLNTAFSQNPEVLLFGVGTQNYTVTVTNPSNGCSSTANAQVQVEYCPAFMMSCMVTINSAMPSVCNPATNTYSVDVEVSWTNAGGTTLTVSTDAPGATPQTITTTAGSSSTQTVTFAGLTANGVMDYDVTAQFDATCTVTDNAAFDAPAACTPACNLAITTAAAACQAGETGKYDLVVTLNYANSPGGAITVTLGTGQTATSAATILGSSGSLMVTFTGLSNTGAAGVTVNAAFDAAPCSAPQTTYNAPANCCPAPQTFCPAMGESFDLTAEAGLMGYQWYLNGNPIPGAGMQLYNATVAGVYTWTALDGASCPIGGCCPITLTETCICVNPTHNAPTTAMGDCTGPTPNNNATITITGIANADQAGIIAGADYTGGPVYGAVGNVSVVAGSLTFSGLMHNTQYTIRIFNAANNCYTDVTFTSASITCFVCPTLALSSPAPQVICEGTGFNFNVTGTTNDPIRFIYFTSPVADPYTAPGGTILASSITPVETAPGSGVYAASLAGGAPCYDGPALPGPGTYYVYAIFATPPAVPSCRPATDIVLTVNPRPAATLSMVCTPDRANIELGVNIPAAGSYDVTITSGVFSLTGLSCAQPEGGGTIPVTTGTATGGGTTTFTVPYHDPYHVRLQNSATGCRQFVTTSGATPCCAEVEAGTPQTICSTRPLQLSLLGASITPASLGGVWSSSGDGIFLDGGGLPATAFGTAAMYIPGTNDIQSGTVTLTLTSNDPAGACPPVSDTVVITILPVDCGNFPWDGN